VTATRVTPPDALAVVVVSHNSADHLPRLLSALSAQLRAGDEVVVVDNASVDGSADVARQVSDAVQVVETGANLGFGGGCHIGARSTAAPLLFFINPDSEPEANCLNHLRTAATILPEWGAWQAAVLLPDGTVNTGGGIVHYLGMGWAGDCGRPARSLSPVPREVAFPSGAAMVVRRSTWDCLGGLDRSYFLYCEDLDLGLRVWLAGQRVGIVPAARVIHSYEFDKGTSKWFWLERNRISTVLSVYPLPLLALLLPGLLAAELALVAVAARQGWLGAKLRAQAAAVAALPRTLRRRRAIQATARVTAAQFARHLTASLDSEYVPLDDASWPAGLQRAYWSLVKRTLGLLRG
jgi:hypothetical protein